MRRQIIFWGLLWGLFGWASLGARGQSSVMLGWDPSPDSTVTGYNIYLGGATQTYTNTVNAGNTNLAVIGGLLPGATYYFAATAYDAIGLESTFSSEVSYTVPTTAAIQLVLLPGSPLRLTGRAPAGYRYEVQTSTDFTNWASLGRISPDPNGLLQFTNAVASGTAFRCFRLHQIAPY